jgi:putative ABC transport system permease protein
LARWRSSILPAGRAGLTAPGAMYRSKMRVPCPPAPIPPSTVEALKRISPMPGSNSAPATTPRRGPNASSARMGEFLVLVGLAALAIAGNRHRRRRFLLPRGAARQHRHAEGAGRDGSADIARIYLLQIGAAALAGSLAGLVAGVLVTPLLGRALGDLLPVAGGFVLDPGALVRAAAYGLLVALVFAVPPLLAARRFPAMALMRARVTPLPSNRRELVLPVGLGLAAIASLAMLTAAQPLVTAWFLAGALALLALLGALGWAIRAGRRRVPRPRDPLLRACARQPASPRRTDRRAGDGAGLWPVGLRPAGGVQTSLDANIDRRVPARAPDYFVLDVPRDREADAFRAASAHRPQGEVRTVPALRGAILAYGPEGRDGARLQPRRPFPRTPGRCAASEG